jgi:2-polyprenyl-3-methyl-5-hydroxy-6-metoxy-1,4-benzoquinol methylase
MPGKNDAYTLYNDYDRIFRAKHDAVIFPERIYQQITRRVHGEVLDIGTGDGYKLFNILKGCAKGLVRNVTALDPSPLAEQATDMLRPFRVRVMRKDWTDFSRTNTGQFDTILCFEVLEHLDDQEKFLNELKRMLKPGGTLICSTPNRPVYRLSCRISGETPDPTHVKELDFSQLRSLMKRVFSRTEYAGFFPYMKAYQKFPWMHKIDRLLPFLFWTRTFYCFAEA